MPTSAMHISSVVIPIVAKIKAFSSASIIILAR